YRVCAIEEGTGDRSCSDWVSVRTLPRPNTGTAVPYFTGHTPTTTKITVTWGAAESYGFYQVRWAQNGHDDGQNKIEYSGNHGSFTARGLAPSTTYHFIVQGCHTTLFGSSCTNFSAPLFV